MKETAVEWLIKQMVQSTTMKGWIEIFDKAKEMEKQQIIDACEKFGNLNGVDIEDYEQYYNEKFKNKKMKKEKVLLQSSIDGEPIWGYEEDIICVYVEDKNQSNNYCSNCGKQMWQHKTPKNYIKNYINNLKKNKI